MLDILACDIYATIFSFERNPFYCMLYIILSYINIICIVYFFTEYRFIVYQNMHPGLSFLFAYMRHQQSWLDKYSEQPL